MKRHFTFLALSVASAAFSLATVSCEKPPEEPANESPATEVSPSVPVPQPADANEVGEE